MEKKETLKKIYVIGLFACLLTFMAAALLMVSNAAHIYSYILLGISVLSAAISSASMLYESYLEVHAPARPKKRKH